jgi:hypothetical protein
LNIWTQIKFLGVLLTKVCIARLFDSEVILLSLVVVVLNWIRHLLLHAGSLICATLFAGFHWGISSQVLGAIHSVVVILHNKHAFVRNKLTIWPISSLELGENKHALVADLKSSNSWNLLEVWSLLIIVWHEIVVEVKRQILLWNLIFHDHGIWNSIDDCSSNLLEEFDVLSLVMAGVPSVVFAVLASFNYKDNVVL